MVYAVRMTRLFLLILVVLGLASAGAGEIASEPESVRISQASGPLRIGIVGLVHGHVEGLLWNASKRDDIKIVGIYEPNTALFERLAAKYNVDPAIRFDSLEKMLDQGKPEAVSVMTSIKDHLPAVEACAPRGVHVMVEKPLAFSSSDAERIAALAKQHGILVLTNYETSWYASLREAKQMIESGAMSPIRKMIFRHGHKGPKEIGCGPEFLAWLTDPEQNGGGAIVDFGCYGAVLSTWLMNGERPTRVVASAATLKPDIYPKVDDDATIVLTYPHATAIIEASWAWTHDNKEADIYTEKGSIHAGKWNDLSVRAENQPPKAVKPGPGDFENEWVYLRKVLRGECPVDPLSSLEMNLVAVEILDEARRQVAANSK